MQEMTGQAAALTEAISRRQQYEVLRILAQYESDRAAATAFLKLVDLQLRDALVMRYSPDVMIGTDSTSAQRLSGSLTPMKCRAFHDALQNACDALQANVSVKLALAALGGALRL